MDVISRMSQEEANKAFTKAKKRKDDDDADADIISAAAADVKALKQFMSERNWTWTSTDDRRLSNSSFADATSETDDDPL